LTIDEVLERDHGDSSGAAHPCSVPSATIARQARAALSHVNGTCLFCE
jgi:hypothetical protein